MLKCPHCGITIEVVALNCGIFRCGIYKKTGVQIDPHLSKEECDKIKDIWGCGKPFQYINGKLEPCLYI